MADLYAWLFMILAVSVAVSTFFLWRIARQLRDVIDRLENLKEPL